MSIFAESMSIIVCADVTTNVSVIVMIGVGAGALGDVEVVVTSAAAIAFDIVFKVSHDVEALPGLLTGAIIASAHGIAAEVAVMTVLEFTLPAPLEDSSISC